jgi:3-dehydroquinate synthase
MTRLRVTSQTTQYDVVLGRGAWRALRKLARSGYTSTLVLSERGLWQRWGEPFLRASELKTARPIFVPSGEMSKSLHMVERVAGELLARGADRHSLLVAFGGGVIGDLGGFVASTYMRGIDCVQVPTTVVAQVDSAIGGKTAVNVGAMKNLIGTFYPPRLVVADPVVLRTLDRRAFRSGFFEVVKHAALSGPGLLGEVERALGSLRPQRAASLGPLLARAARVKVEVVSSDEKEAGLRRVLNLGHTFGHGLEEATGYQRFLHGEAVGWGMLGALRLSEILGLIPPAESQRIAAVIQRLGPLPPIRDLKVSRVLSLLPRDKKAVGGNIHWVLPERIGKVRIVADVPAFAVEAAFQDIQRADRHE